MKILSLKKYLLLINQSYARGWETAIKHYDEIEQEKKINSRSKLTSTA